MKNEIARQIYMWFKMGIEPVEYKNLIFFIHGSVTHGIYDATTFEKMHSGSIYEDEQVCKYIDEECRRREER